MHRILIYFGRFLVIFAGYCAACLTASLMLHILLLPQFGLVVPGTMTMAAITISLPFAALFIAYFALLPSIVLVVIGEFWRLQSWLYHALGGGAVGLFVAMLFRTQADPSESASLFQSLAAIAALIAAGIVGGIAYWLVAGRSAGDWMGRAVTSRER